MKNTNSQHLDQAKSLLSQLIELQAISDYRNDPVFAKTHGLVRSDGDSFMLTHLKRLDELLNLIE